MIMDDASKKAWLDRNSAEEFRKSRNCLTVGCVAFTVMCPLWLALILGVLRLFGVI